MSQSNIILLLILGSAFVASAISVMVVYWSSKSETAKIDLASVQSGGSIFYIVLYVLDTSLAMRTASDSAFATSLGLGSFIGLFVGILPVFIFSWITTRIFCRVKHLEYVNTGGSSFGAY